MNVLFFKVDIHTQLFHISNGFEQRDGVAGEAADGFGDDHVDLPGAAISKQPIEFMAVVLCA